MSDDSEQRPVAVLKVSGMDRTVAWYTTAWFAVRGRGDDPGNALAEPVVAEWGIEEREWGPREAVLTDPDGYYITLSEARA